MRGVGSALLLAALVSGCTQDAAAPEAAQPTASAPEAPASGAAPSTDGPLRLDGEGRGCAALQHGRDFAWWEHVIEPSDDIEVTSFRLVGARGVRTMGDGFVSPAGSRVASTGFTLGWPPAAAVTGSRHLRWDQRRPAVGAELDGGSRSNLWIHVRVDPSVPEARFRAMQLGYTSAGRDYVVRDRIRTSFARHCS
jgi:hypothetical protein